jgi:hypothetical protein
MLSLKGVRRAAIDAPSNFADYPRVRRTGPKHRAVVVHLNRRALREVTWKENTVLGRLLHYLNGFAVDTRADRTGHEWHSDIDFPTQVRSAQV